MGLVLVMALAVPASAGINTEINGKVQTDFYYDTHDGAWAWGDVETKITMSAGTDGAIKAVLGLGATEANDEGIFGQPNSPFTAENNVVLKVNTAYIQADGAWLEGGPGVTTKIGRFGTNYSNWAAKIGDRDGIELSNVNLGPLSLAGLYAWVNEAPFNNDAITGAANFAGANPADVVNAVNALDWRIMAVKGSTNVDSVKLEGAYVNTISETTAKLNDYVLTASLTPVEGLAVDGTFAGTNYELPFIGTQAGTGWKVNAELSTIPEVKLGATVWASTDEFNPVYTDLDGNKPKSFNGHDKPNERRGVEVRANTSQAGFDLGLTVKNTTAADGSNSASSFTFTAKRVFDAVTGEYKYESADKRHTITATTTVDTPVAKAVNLKGTVRLAEGSDLEYAADATWQAPNGLNLGLHYANYDRGDGWGGRDIGPGGDPDGFVFKAGYTLNW